MIFKTFFPFIENMKQQAYSNVYIWGVGVYGDSIGQLLDRYAIHWDGYYDNYWNGEPVLNGKPIFDGKQFADDGTAVYIVSIRDSCEVVQQLHKGGVPDMRIIWAEDSEFFESLQENLIGSTEYCKAIQKFKNIHRGEECFIIGNGPSLQIGDLEKIWRAKIPSFGCNFIFNCYDKTSWRPNYYFAVDSKILRDILDINEQMREIVLGNCQYMFSRSDTNFFRLYHDPAIKNLIFYRGTFSKSTEELEFSGDCSQKIYIGYTVTYAMLQVAVYMGFSKIYLLGIDHHYTRERNGEGDIAVDDSVKDYAEIVNFPYPVVGVPLSKTTKAYEAAKRYADTHGIQIYNATRGGRLEVFPRVDFDSLF